MTKSSVYDNGLSDVDFTLDQIKGNLELLAEAAAGDTQALQVVQAVHRDVVFMARTVCNLIEQAQSLATRAEYTIAESAKERMLLLRQISQLQAALEEDAWQHSNNPRLVALRESIEEEYRGDFQRGLESAQRNLVDVLAHYLGVDHSSVEDLARELHNGGLTTHSMGLLAQLAEVQR